MYIYAYVDLPRLSMKKMDPRWFFTGNAYEVKALFQKKNAYEVLIKVVVAYIWY